MPQPVPPPAPPRVLLVDDEPTLLHVFARVLRAEGFETRTAQSGAEAEALLGQERFDAVVSDVMMPDRTGLELLAAVRARNESLPVVLMTGVPTVEGAAQAVQHGSFRYLTKPVEMGLLVEVLRSAVERGRLLATRARAVPAPPPAQAFEDALADLWMAFQPIVREATGEAVAYEALVRTRSAALPHPGALFAAAEALGEVPRLGRLIRARVAEAAVRAPLDCQLFVNLHPLDLLDEALYQDSPLRPLAGRVVLEMTERAALEEVADLGARLARLRAQGYRLAVDDLGAGYAGLSSVALLEPAVLKLDMSLVRGVDRAPTQRRLVASMVGLCRELGRTLVCEGVETAEERAVLRELGCELMQGYLFGRPEAGFRAG